MTETTLFSRATSKNSQRRRTLAFERPSSSNGCSSSELIRPDSMHSSKTRSFIAGRPPCLFMTGTRQMGQTSYLWQHSAHKDAWPHDIRACLTSFPQLLRSLVALHFSIIASLQSSLGSSPANLNNTACHNYS